MRQLFSISYDHKKHHQLFCQVNYTSPFPIFLLIQAYLYPRLLDTTLIYLHSSACLVKKVTDVGNMLLSVLLKLVDLQCCYLLHCTTAPLLTYRSSKCPTIIIVRVSWLGSTFRSPMHIVSPSSSVAKTPCGEPRDGAR